jgi:hypothetical protein
MKLQGEGHVSQSVNVTSETINETSTKCGIETIYEMLRNEF